MPKQRKVRIGELVPYIKDYTLSRKSESVCPHCNKKDTWIIKETGGIYCAKCKLAL